MLDNSSSTQNRVIEMHETFIDSTLFVKTWRRAIDRLNHEKVKAEGELDNQGGAELILSKLKLRAITLEIQVFELCLDRESTRNDPLDDSAGKVEEQRRRFYRLAASVAKAENDLHDGNQMVEFTGAIGEDEAWSAERWVNELRDAASLACHAMVAN